MHKENSKRIHKEKSIRECIRIHNTNREYIRRMQKENALEECKKNVMENGKGECNGTVIWIKQRGIVLNNTKEDILGRMQREEC